MIKVIHITSVHPRLDPRVRFKQAEFLSNYFDTTLLVSDGEGSEQSGNLKIVDIGQKKNRFTRILLSSFAFYKYINKNKFSLVHIHDPELIFLGFFLKIKGIYVVFDSHEDFPKQLLTKSWLRWPFNILFSIIFSQIEQHLYRFFDLIITAEESVKVKFKKYHKNVECIKNYPIPKYNPIRWRSRKHEIVYLGGLSFQRGTDCIIDSLEHIDPKIKLNLIGDFSNKDIMEYVNQSENIERIKLFGYQKIDIAYNIASQSKIGVIPLRNIPNYREALPTKLFEYMMLEIPVVCSDIPLWSKIIKKYNCGLVVEHDPKAFAKSINYLLENNEIAKEMGFNGRRAILNDLNWNSEFNSLLKVYRDLFYNE